MTSPNGAALSGRNLRYAILVCLHERSRPTTVEELDEAIDAWGLSVDATDPDRVGKRISDALRWEVRRGRAVRVRWNLYEAGVIPRTTLRRAQEAIALVMQQATVVHR